MTVLLCVLAVAACGDGSELAPNTTQAPPLPEPQLRDVLTELRGRAAAAPTGPSDERLAELRDLIETAWLPDRATPRTQALAARSLQDEADIDWALEAALLHEEPVVRKQAADQLGRRGRRAAIPLLAVRLRPIGYENDESVRCAMVLALVRLGVLGTIEELSGWMRRAESAQVAGFTAIEVVRACGRDPGEAPSYGDLESALAELIAGWRASGLPPEGSGLPAEPAASDPLLEARLAGLLVALEDFQLRPVDETRFVLTHAGRLGLPLLRDALHAEQPYLRTHGLEIALGLEQVASELAPDILPLLGQRLDAALAATTLGAIGANLAFEHLMARLDSGDLELRAAAAGGLGRLGDLRAVDALLAKLRDEQEAVDVRVQCAFGLALLDPGMRYLESLLAGGGYHEPTLRELIDAVRARRR